MDNAADFSVFQVCISSIALETVSIPLSQNMINFHLIVIYASTNLDPMFVNIREQVLLDLLDIIFMMKKKVIFSFWPFEISEDILRNQKFIIG